MFVETRKPMAIFINTISLNPLELIVRAINEKGNENIHLKISIKWESNYLIINYITHRLLSRPSVNRGLGNKGKVNGELNNLTSQYFIQLCLTYN